MEPKPNTGALYRQLKEVIREQIASGELQPGDRLPSERELSEQYGISRMTVREALSELVREGVVQRRQGKGTFVATPKLVEGLDILRGFTEEIRRRGMRPGTRILAMDQIPAHALVGRHLGLPVGHPVIRIERLRLANEVPTALETVHLDAVQFAGITRLLSPETSLYELLHERYRITLSHADQELEATTADRYLADLLEVNEGAPLLLIERTSFTPGGQPIEYVRSYYRGDRYRYHVRLQR